MWKFYYQSNSSPSLGPGNWEILEKNLLLYTFILVHEFLKKIVWKKPQIHPTSPIQFLMGVFTIWNNYPQRMWSLCLVNFFKKNMVTEVYKSSYLSYVYTGLNFSCNKLAFYWHFFFMYITCRGNLISNLKAG